MPALIHCQQISKSFGVKQLFSNLTIGVDEKDRLGIVGPNGAGKSTLLKIFAGLEKVDQGEVTRRQRLRVAYVPQQAEFPDHATVAEVIEQAGKAAGVHPDECMVRTQEVLGRTGFEGGDVPVGPLSGGWKKRLAIACGWVQSPDMMLLDEPTNHLDFDGLAWLESLMAQTPWPWVMVSHDRWLLDRAVNKIAELNSRYPEGLLLNNGSYGEFLEYREAFQESQTQQAQTLAGKVRREEEWLRRGPKARSTKAKYRVNTAHALQAELAETKARLRQENTDIDFVSSGRKTKRLIAAENLSKSFDSTKLFHDLELTLSPGMGLGILGHNGSGKSTLLKLLAKKGIEPDQGTVSHADALKVVYFDQHREQLNPKDTLRKTLSDTGHTVTYRDRTVHLAAWAKRFQFQPEQLDLPVELLSGGEKARALIARLMLQPADVLIVDEPTNDLDIPTREVLEESLQEFSGALVLVTHDRYMLTRVCTQFLGLDGKGTHGVFAEYQQWETWLRRQGKNQEEKDGARSGNARTKGSSNKKLTYREQKEYDSFETNILKAETNVEQCKATTEDPKVVSDHVRLQKAYDALQLAERQAAQLYERWSELDAKLNGGRV